MCKVPELATPHDNLLHAHRRRRRAKAAAAEAAAPPSAAPVAAAAFTVLDIKEAPAGEQAPTAWATLSSRLGGLRKLSGEMPGERQIIAFTLANPFYKLRNQQEPRLIAA